MVVAFASLQRAPDHTHFLLALSPACVDFLAAHDAVSRLEVVHSGGEQHQQQPHALPGGIVDFGGGGGALAVVTDRDDNDGGGDDDDDWESTPVRSRRTSSAHEHARQDVLNGPAPWSVVASSSSAAGGGDRGDAEAKVVDVETKVNTIEEQRRLRHRQRRLEKEARARAKAEALQREALNPSITPSLSSSSSSTAVAAAAAGSAASVVEGGSPASETNVATAAETGTTSSPKRAIESKLMDLVVLQE